MSRRARWWLSALFVAVEVLTLAGLIWTGEARVFARQVYVSCWRMVTDEPPPDRFLPRTTGVK